jgi:hypothetical protein
MNIWPGLQVALEHMFEERRPYPLYGTMSRSW